MSDYIPFGDKPFDEWCRNFLDRAKQHTGPLEMTLSDLTEMAALHAAWSVARRQYVELTAAQAEASKERKKTRKECERGFRRRVGILKYRDKVTDELRVELGLNPLARNRGRPVDLDRLDRPSVVVQSVSGHTLFLIILQDDGEKAKPRGVKAVRIEVTRDGPEAPDEAWTFVRTLTRMSDTVDLGEDAVGKYWVRGRWVDHRGRLSPPGTASYGSVAEATGPAVGG